MGADNQADRVLVRMEWREELAEIYHQASNDIYPWPRAARGYQENVIKGITAVLNEINRRING